MGMSNGTFWVLARCPTRRTVFSFETLPINADVRKAISGTSLAKGTADVLFKVDPVSARLLCTYDSLLVFDVSGLSFSFAGLG